ncbi:MAG TPA: DsbC family protein [Steroidobacteraceae bacterium]|jgi:thiol:disulfide interchange protein DsbC
MRRLPRLSVLLSLAALLPGLTLAGDLPESIVGPIKKNLYERYPQITIVDVKASDVAGIYEVFTGETLVYVDKDAEHLFAGRLFDTRSRRDLLSERLDAYNGIDFEKLPFERAIKVVKGNGSRRLAVFEDPDCPYCQKLEQALKDMTDLTVYVFLYPIDDLHPQATLHAKQIWCSGDRATAWTGWVSDRKPLEDAKCDNDPMAENVKLAAKLRVSATPTLFSSAGHRILGNPPVDRLQAFIDGVKPPSVTPKAARGVPSTQEAPPSAASNKPASRG